MVYTSHKKGDDWGMVQWYWDSDNDDIIYYVTYIYMYIYNRL